MLLTDVMTYLMRGTLTNIKGVLRGDGKTLGEVGVDTKPVTGSKNLIESGAVKSALAEEILYITIESLTELPYTINNSVITNQHIVLEATLSRPSMRTQGWNVVTSNGSLTIQGTGDNHDGGIIGTTSMTLKLGRTGTYFSG